MYCKIIILIILLLLLYIFFINSNNCKNNIENFTEETNMPLSNEAIQNIASIYNKDKMIISNMRVMDKLEAMNIEANKIRINEGHFKTVKLDNLTEAEEIKTKKIISDDGVFKNITNEGNITTNGYIKNSNGLYTVNSKNQFKIDTGRITTNKSGNGQITFNENFTNEPNVFFSYTHNENEVSRVVYIRSMNNKICNIKSLNSKNGGGLTVSIHWMAVGV